MSFNRIIAKGMKKLLQPPAITNSKVDSKAHIASAASVNNTSIGKYSYIGDGSFTVNCEIGPFCSIAYNCQIGGAMHPIQRVSTSPVFHKGVNSLGKNFALFDCIKTPRTILGADVWIGVNAVIKSGVTIGDGSVIGAGSIVTKDIPAYEIWAGNPAHKIRDRFPEDIKMKLLEMKWWEWDDDKIKEYAKYFDDPEKLIHIVESR